MLIKVQFRCKLGISIIILIKNFLKDRENHIYNYKSDNSAELYCHINSIEA